MLEFSLKTTWYRKAENESFDFLRSAVSLVGGFPTGSALPPVIQPFQTLENEE
jgi:hypothetical protein